MGRGDNNLLFNPPVLKSQVFRPRKPEKLDLPPLTLGLLEREGERIILAENHYERSGRNRQSFSFKARDVNCELPFSINPSAVAWVDDSTGREDLPRGLSVIVQEEEVKLIGLPAPPAPVENLFASDRKVYCQTESGLYVALLEKEEGEEREWRLWDTHKRASVVPGLDPQARKSEKLLPGRDGALLFFRQNGHLNLVYLDSEEGGKPWSMAVEEKFLAAKSSSFAKKNKDEVYLTLDRDLYLFHKQSGDLRKVRSYDSEILALDTHGDRLLLLLSNKELAFVSEGGEERRVSFPHPADEVQLGQREFITRLGDFATRWVY